jgi:hypothetical protein
LVVAPELEGEVLDYCWRWAVWFSVFLLASFGDVHSFREVLPQGEVEVADLELLGEFERDITVLLTTGLDCARQPFIDRCLRDFVAPPAVKALSVCVVWQGIQPGLRILTRNTMK